MGHSNVEAEPEETMSAGYEAVEDYRFKVTLVEPDLHFPRLAALPVLRPVYVKESDLEESDDPLLTVSPETVTNGAFRIVEASEKGIVLERSASYYARSSVELEKARLVISEKQGRSRLLYLNIVPIQQIHERWSDEYSALWANRLTSIKFAVESKREEQK